MIRKIHLIMAILLVGILVFGLTMTGFAEDLTEEQKEVQEKLYEPVDFETAEDSIYDQVPGKTIEDPSELTIGFSIYTQAAPYFGVMMRTLEDLTEDMGAEFIGTNADDDLEKQLNDVQDLISRGIDVLILNPKDPEALVPSVELANKQGIPVICIDNPIAEDAPVVSTVTSDNHRIGKLVGEWTASQFDDDEEIKTAFISGQQGSRASNLRRTGFTEGFTEQRLKDENSYNLNIVTQQWGNWNTPDGQTAMEDILVAHSDIDLLMAENDAMALGARQAIKEEGKEDDILVVAAADGQKEAMELIMDEDENYGASGLNSPTIAAATAIEVAKEVMRGQKVPETIYTPAVAVTEENVDEWYDPEAEF